MGSFVCSLTGSLWRSLALNFGFFQLAAAPGVADSEFECSLVESLFGLLALDLGAVLVFRFQAAKEPLVVNSRVN
jgi:hypothetical protein